MCSECGKKNMWRRRPDGAWQNILHARFFLQRFISSNIHITCCQRGLQRVRDAQWSHFSWQVRFYVSSSDRHEWLTHLLSHPAHAETEDLLSPHHYRRLHTHQKIWFCQHSTLQRQVVLIITESACVLKVSLTFIIHHFIKCCLCIWRLWYTTEIYCCPMTIKRTSITCATCSFITMNTRSPSSTSTHSNTTFNPRMKRSRLSNWWLN